MHSDVLTLGSATRDVFLFSEEFTVIKSQKFSTGYAECVNLGGKIPVEQCVLATGGGATNSATTFTKLGFRTGIISKIGNDEPGNAIEKELKENGIETTFLKKDRKGQTAYSTLLTAKDGERSALVFRGVSGTWSACDIPPLPKETRALYITSLGDSASLKIVENVIKEAKKKSIFIAWNPGTGELKQQGTMFRILPLIDALLCNHEEAQILLEKKVDAATACIMLKKYVPLCIVTKGNQGSYAHNHERLLFAQARPDITAISRTGAGDAFSSACIAALLKGHPLQEALQIGTLNAESVIKQIGAKTGILTSWPTKKQRETIIVKPYRV